jgi:hypothetical protein
VWTKLPQDLIQRRNSVLAMIKLRVVLPKSYFISSTIETLMSLRLLVEMDRRSLNYVLILYTLPTK